MRIGWKRLVVCALSCSIFGFTGCASMQEFGNSLAFWKKSPPKDQFATNLTKPSTTFNPTGTNIDPNSSLASTRPGSTPFPKTGRPQGGSFAQNNNSFGTGNPSTGFGRPAAGGSSSSMMANTGVPGMRGAGSTTPGSNPSNNMRSPYGSQMPGSGNNSSGFGTQNGQASHMAQNTRPQNSTAGGGFSPSSGGFSSGGNSGFKMPNSTLNSAPKTPSSGSSSFNPGNSGGSNFSTNTAPKSPSSQFRSSTPNSGFQTGTSSGPSTPTTPPASSGFSPTSAPAKPQFPSTSQFSQPTQNTPSNPAAGGTSPAARPSASDNWQNYPTTNYPGFGSTSTKSPATPASPTFESKNVPASANMTPPPSLPSTVLERQGGYSPGSTSTSGKASQAGFDSTGGLYSPPTGSKIPSTSTGLYTPQ